MDLKLLAALKSVWLIREQSMTTGTEGEPYINSSNILAVELIISEIR
jgi:hypothetical protein